MTAIPRSSTERQLAAVASIAEQLAHQWPAYLATVAAMSPPLLRAAGRDTGRGSGHADPTPTLALSLDHHDELVEAVGAWLAQGRWIQDRMRAPLGAEGPGAREAEADLSRLRCSGAVDPTCTRLAVVSNAPGNKWAGLCWACIKRGQRGSVQAGHKGIPADVQDAEVRSASLDTSASTEGTCGRCGTVVRGVSVSAVRDLLAAHHVTDCPASSRG